MVRDGDWELLGWNPATGISTWRMDLGDRYVIKTECPADKTLEANTQERNAASKGWGGDWHKVASIPLNLMYDGAFAEALREGDDKFAARWLNDSDNQAFRTKGGTI